MTTEDKNVQKKKLHGVVPGIPVAVGLEAPVVNNPISTPVNDHVLLKSTLQVATFGSQTVPACPVGTPVVIAGMSTAVAV